MGKIFVTGDTHWGVGDEQKVERLIFKANEDDIVIICGDFGAIWDDREDKNLYLNFIENVLPFTVAFCDGNHENFNKLYSYPVESWNGGKVHRIRKNIVHLIRGEIYYIFNKTFWTFGGGFSFDKMQRKLNKSWWPQEMPSLNEMQEGLNKLEKYGKVDYIITHTGPESIVNKILYGDNSIKRVNGETPLNRFFQLIYNDKTKYSKWFFGHLHEDVDDQDISCLYKRVVELEDLETKI